MENLKIEIDKILNSELIGFNIETGIRIQPIGNDKYIKVSISTSNFEINNVSRQYHNHISFMIEEDLTLRFQIFGGMGGQSIYRSVDENNPKEKFYALQRVKIPFRTPKKDRDSVLKAIKNICTKYKEILKTTLESGLLRSDDLEAAKKLIYKN